MIFYFYDGKGCFYILNYDALKDPLFYKSHIKYYIYTSRFDGRQQVYCYSKETRWRNMTSDVNLAEYKKGDVRDII